MQFTVTESHIPENWGGLTEVNHVNRLMVPGANGTPLDFSSQTTQTVMLNFPLNAAGIMTILTLLPLSKIIQIKKSCRDTQLLWRT